MGTPISGLPADSSVGGAEQVPLNDGGTTKRATTQQIADLAPGSSAGALSGSDTFPVFQSGARKAGTLSALATYVAGTLSGTDVRTAVADADYTVLTTDRIVSITSLTAQRTITLPTASSAGAGRWFTIEDSSDSAESYPVIIDGNGSETIDGYTRVLLARKRQSITVQSDGSNWRVIHGRAVPDPTAIATPFAWFDAARGVTLSGSTRKVTDWADQSGNARHVTQSTASRRPRAVACSELGGYPVLSFDTTDELYTSSTVTMNNSWTIFALVKTDWSATSVYCGLMACGSWVGGADSATSGVAVWLKFTGTTGKWQANQISATGAGYNGSVYATAPWETRAGNSFALLSVQLGSSSSGIWLDGVKLDGDGTSGGAAATSVTDELYIGSTGEGRDNFCLNGYLAEIMIMPGALSTGDRQAVEAYFQRKFDGVGAA